MDATVYPRALELKVHIPTPRVTVRSCLSTQQLWGARHLSRRVGEIEAALAGRSGFDIEHRSLAIGSVVLSVAFLESAINELFQDVVDGHQSYTRPLSAERQAVMRCFWFQGGDWAPALEKYQEALAAAKANQFSKGRAPLQNAKALVQLRNALMHFKPESGNITDKSKIRRALARKFEWNRLMEGSGNPFFPDHCLGHGCTEWAHSTAKHLVDVFANRIGLELNCHRAVLSEP